MDTCFIVLKLLTVFESFMSQHVKWEHWGVGVFLTMTIVMATNSTMASETKSCGFSALTLSGKTMSARRNYEISYYHPQNDTPSLIISNLKTGQSCESSSAIEQGMFISADEKRLLALWKEDAGYYVDLVDMNTCQVIKQLSGGPVTVLPNQIRIEPLCDCKSSTSDCTCEPAQVFDLRSDCDPVLVPAESAGVTSDNEQWFRCKTAAECVIAQGNCDVEWAVNKEFAAVSRHHPPRPDGVCSKPLESHPANSVALCIEGQCQLYPAGTLSGGYPMGDNCLLSSCWGHLGCNYLNCTRKDGSTYTEYAQ